MEKERKIKSMSLVALIVAVLGLTVAFAAMSRTLTINGTATMDTATWDIHFEGVSGKSTTDNNITTIVGQVDTSTNQQNAAVSTVNPTIQADGNGRAATVISQFNVTVTKPGDIVTYEFDVVNAGTIDAYLATVNGTSKDDLTFTGTAQDSSQAAADAALVKSNLVYTLTYSTSNGAAVTNSGANINLDRATGTTPRRRLVLTIGYDPAAEALPSADVNITGFNIQLTYNQRNTTN